MPLSVLKLPLLLTASVLPFTPMSSCESTFCSASTTSFSSFPGLTMSSPGVEMNTRVTPAAACVNFSKASAWGAPATAMTTMLQKNPRATCFIRYALVRRQYAHPVAQIEQADRLALNGSRHSNGAVAFFGATAKAAGFVHQAPILPAPQRLARQLALIAHGRVLRGADHRGRCRDLHVAARLDFGARKRMRANEHRSCHQPHRKATHGGPQRTLTAKFAEP